MNFWRQIRWRIVAANMLVVVVGVSIVLLMAFRQSIFSAVLVAALGAILAGLLISFFLAREILRPLRQIAASSQRIANGHYDERISVSGSDELALVATNFNQMAEALARMEETRVALIGDVSHELRTPLTSLEGFLEGMLDDVFPANEETFALMYQEVRRLKRLVADLQTLSRVESGQISLKMEIFDIRAIVTRVAAQLQPQLVDQALDVQVEMPETAVPVYADLDRTAQVLLNLLGNALRYTPENGRICVRVWREGRFAYTAVQDSGVGIDPTKLPLLFERFYRADHSRTRSSGGSGIGLTISRHLVWGMGGELTASSAGIGQGACFTFSLLLDYTLTAAEKDQRA